MVLLGGVLVATIWALLRVVGVLRLPPEVWQVGPALYRDMLLLLALLALAGTLAYHIAASLTMGYQVDRNGVYVHWLGNRLVIPMESIERVEPGRADAVLSWRVVYGLVGTYRGTARTHDGTPLRLFATRPPHDCLWIHTRDSVYALSPAKPDAFVQDLEQRRRLGAITPLTPTCHYGWLFAYPFWNDRVVRSALLLAVALNLLLFGVLAFRYPELAADVRMRFNAVGEVTELRPRHQILFLPLAASGLLLLNLGLGVALYPREQTGARLLQLASVLMPVLFGVAVFAIIGR